MTLWLYILIQATVLAYALVGGVFLAFSDFIMRSLALSGQGAGTMRVINREVFRWVFMALFLGLVPVSLGLAFVGYGALEGAARYWVVLAAIIYVAGCFGVTVLRNVPMNTALENLGDDTEASEAYWTDTYLPRWTFWNSVRTLACVLSALCLQCAVWVSMAG
jgi:uncharacterized membrane protein